LAYFPPDQAIKPAPHIGFNMHRHQRLAILAAMILPLNTALAELSPYERYEGSQEEEHALIEALAEKFLIVQNISRHQGKKVRGTHAKGTCVAGEFEVFEQMEPAYQIGLFSEAATYPARVRFANGGSSVKADSEPDARAISLSLDLGGRGLQEFAMNNGPIFPIDNLTNFNFLLDIGFVRGQAIKAALEQGKSMQEAEAAGKKAAGEHLAANPTKVAGFLRVTKLGAELTDQVVDSYRNRMYWSGSAFMYGDDQVAKFAMSPCSKGAAPSPDKTDPDYLQNDLKNAVNSEDAAICFDFQVQMLDAEKMKNPEGGDGEKLEAWQWVEDVTLDWDKAGAPYKTVARLTITPFSVYEQSECDDPKNAIDVMANSLPEHRGLGRINRARARSESASRDNRP